MENNKENNKEERQIEKIKCECGALVSRCNLTRHLRTIKHLRKTECIILD